MNDFQPGALDLSREFHGLFLPEDGVSHDGYEPEVFKWIEVVRYGSTGKIRAPRNYTPFELSGFEALYQRFGGGTYELTARRATGTIYAKRMHTLAGAQKPLVDAETDAVLQNGASPAAAPMAAPAPVHAGSAVDPSMQLLFTVLVEGQRSTATLLAAAVTALATRGDGGGSSEERLKLLSEIVRNLQPPAVAAPAGGGIREALEVSKAIRDEAKSMAEFKRPPPPPEESTSATVKGIIEAVGPIIGNLAMSAATAKPPLPGGTT